MRATTTIAIAAAFIVAACELFVDTGGLSSSAASDGGNGQDAAPDAAGSDGAGGDSGGGTDANVDAGDATVDSGCPGKAGPTMVSVGTYCIDSTEVTNAQYDAFLASNPLLTLQPAAVCAFNTSFARKCTGPTSANTAVTCVNWCDAYAYCAWAGKRLCGAIGGGPSTQATMSSAASDQWYKACSNDGTHLYPYGVTYQQWCNDGNHGVGHAVDVGSLPNCLGGYPGLFDMSGNVVEWVDVCKAQTGTNDDCFIRGGAWDDTPSANSFLTCASQSSNARGSTDDTKGFRCCGP